jgi:hypothetical protein
VKFTKPFLFAVLFLASCAAPLTPAPTQTFTPEPTQVPSPTETTPPELFIEGSAVNIDAETPMSNVLFILCPKQDEASCIVDTDFTSRTDESGRFKISNLEPGAYAILYSVSGNIPPDLNNKVLDYSPESTSADPAPGNVNHLMKSLGVSTLKTCNAYYEVVDGNMVVSGYVYVDALDLAFIFLSGDLIYVTVTDTPVTMDLRIWDTEDESHCDGDFNPLQ